MAVTELGMVIEASAVQPRKAYSSMVFIELGKMMEDKSVQKENAHNPIEVTVFGIVTEVRLQPVPVEL